MSVIFNHISIEILADYLKATGLPIVSVGCGNGVCEKELEKAGITSLILVDPDPESFQEYPEDESTYLKPNYPYVKDLIEDKPDIVGECTLFLCWPDPNDSTYDIESVNLLNPRFVVVFYETIGGAGGEEFHDWLFEAHAPCSNVPCGKYQHDIVSLYDSFKRSDSNDISKWLSKKILPMQNISLGEPNNMYSGIKRIFPLSNRHKFSARNNYKCEKEYIKCLKSRMFIHALVLIKREDDITDVSHLESKFIIY